MKNVNRIADDGEKDSVSTNSLAVNQLPNLDIERFAFLSQWAAFGKILKPVNRSFQTVEPLRRAVGRALGNPQISAAAGDWMMTRYFTRSRESCACA